APTTPATRYQLDRAVMEAAWSGRTAAVQLATPSNPTGTTIAFDELEAVCGSARERGAWRIVDEIYLSLADPAPDGSSARTALEADPDAVIVSSFSKYFGMTGWRLGWLVLPEALVGPADDLAVNFFLCASTPTQLAAVSCFTPSSLAACEDRRLELLARRGIVLDGLERIGLPVPVRPDGAFYAYFDVSGTGLDAWTFCERALEESHVALTPGIDFGPATGDTHVRLSYAAGRDELAEGLERLGGFVAGL
ncbi:aminotransferase class I/II-fold pyridoxal phosphate-dependent enzyme, partial [Propionibacterium acidifaciens]